MCSPKRHILAACIGVLCLTLGVRSSTAQTAVRVERVVDGETLIVSGGGQGRLLTVDVPRTIDAQRPDDDSADPAIVFLRALLADGTVRLEYDVRRTDTANRLLAYVYLSDGRLVNAELLRLGFGRVNAEIALQNAGRLPALRTRGPGSAPRDVGPHVSGFAGAAAALGVDAAATSAGSAGHPLKTRSGAFPAVV